MKAERALLKLGNGPQIQVADEHQLRALLEPLGDLPDGKAAALSRGKSNFIIAVRFGKLWSVTTKRGRMWTAQSFTAEMTSDYSERRVREGRQHRSLRERLLWWLRSPLPVWSLSTKQVRTLFEEYLTGRKFTLPMLGV